MLKLCKNFIIFCLSLLTFLNLFIIPVQAIETIDTGFKITSVNYDVELKENGDATVIEHWYLEYRDVGNTFDKRFIPKYSKSLAKSTTLDNLRIYIDENICNEIKNTEYQEDYTYNVEENEKGYWISVFKSSSKNDKIQITFVYTLKDLVKSVENEYYYINFEPMPYSVSKVVKDLNVTFRLYNGEKIKLVDTPITFPLTVNSVEQNNLKIYNSRLDESKQTISFKITNDCFNIPSEKVISKKDLPLQPKPINLFLIVAITYFLISAVIIKLKGRSLKAHMHFKRMGLSIIMLFLIAIATQSFIITGGFALFLIFLIFAGFEQEEMLIKHEKNIKKLQKDPTMIKDIIMKYRNIIDYKNILDTASTFSHLSFFARLVDAHQKRLLNVSDDGTVIFELKEENKKEPIFKILKKIKRYCDKKHIIYITNGEKITFTIDIFKKYFEKPDNYRYVFGIFHPLDNNVHSKFYKEEKDKQLRKEFNEDCLALASLSEVLNKENISFKEFLNTPISPDTYIAFLQNNLAKRPEGEHYNEVDLSMYEIYKKHIEICTKKKRDPITGEYLNAGD